MSLLVSSPNSPPVTVELRELTKENYLEVLLLEVEDRQKKFIANNFKTFAQAHFDPTSWLRAAYHNDLPVGLLLLTIEREDYQELRWAGQPYLWRLMVAEQYQGKGIGTAIMAKIIEEVFTWKGATALYLSVVEENRSARSFYSALGFSDLNLTIEDERVLKFDLV